MNGDPTLWLSVSVTRGVKLVLKDRIVGCKLFTSFAELLETAGKCTDGTSFPESTIKHVTSQPVKTSLIAKKFIVLTLPLLSASCFHINLPSII
jgi:hypothetical protein